MTATLLEGRSLAASYREQLRAQVAAFRDRGLRSPHLRIVLVGSDETSRLYAEGLRKSGASLGLSVTIDHYGASVTRVEVMGAIEALNDDDDVDGVVVTMPLPAQLSRNDIACTLSPAKDADGITETSAGALYSGALCHVPSTAAAIMELLTSNNVAIAGRNAVIVGRSIVVGRPAAMLLLQQDATVTVCHTKTSNLAEHTTRADILVVAVGSPRFIRGNMIKPKAIVLDAGINSTPDGIVGDVDFEEAEQTAGAITPVPGGIGPLTNVLLLRSVVRIASARLVQASC